MNSSIGTFISSIAVAGLVLGGAATGCKELVDTLENSEKEMEAHRMGGPKKKQVESAEDESQFEESLPAVKGPDLKGRKLPAGSAESRLFAEIVKRIKCSEPECSQDVLTRIRKDRGYFSKGFGPLLDGEQSVTVTLEAVKIAGLLRIKAAAPAVGGLAVKMPGEVRGEAVWTLGNIGGAEAVRQLRRLSAVGTNREMQERICSSYGRIKREDAIPDVAELLRSDSAKVRGACALALGMTGSDRAVSFLSPLLKDARSTVRRAAKRALRAIGGAAAKKALQSAAP